MLSGVPHQIIAMHQAKAAGKKRLLAQSAEASAEPDSIFQPALKADESLSEMAFEDFAELRICLEKLFQEAGLLKDAKSPQDDKSSQDASSDSSLELKGWYEEIAALEAHSDFQFYVPLVKLAKEIAKLPANTSFRKDAFKQFSQYVLRFQKDAASLRRLGFSISDADVSSYQAKLIALNSEVNEFFKSIVELADKLQRIDQELLELSDELYSDEQGQGKAIFDSLQGNHFELLDSGLLRAISSFNSLAFSGANSQDKGDHVKAYKELKYYLLDTIKLIREVYLNLKFWHAFTPIVLQILDQLYSRLLPDNANLIRRKKKTEFDLIFAHPTSEITEEYLLKLIETYSVLIELEQLNATIEAKSRQPISDQATVVSQVPLPGFTARARETDVEPFDTAPLAEMDISAARASESKDVSHAAFNVLLTSAARAAYNAGLIEAKRILNTTNSSLGNIEAIRDALEAVSKAVQHPSQASFDEVMTCSQDVNLYSEIGAGFKLCLAIVVITLLLGIFTIPTLSGGWLIGAAVTDGIVGVIGLLNCFSAARQWYQNNAFVRSLGFFAPGTELYDHPDCLTGQKRVRATSAEDVLSQPDKGRAMEVAFLGSSGVTI